jgi:hypothetical protein
LFKYKRIVLITLLVFGSAGFSFLDDFNINNPTSVLEAARRSNRNSSNKKTSGKSKKTESKKETSKNSDDSSDNDLLMDNEKSRDYMPDIFRCPDCGYEQDEAGYCPDHTTLELVKIISDVKNPLAPSEFDGNEDILVDVPLNIDFKKDELEKKDEEATTEDKKKSSNKSNEKSSKKSKKSK